MPPTLSTIMSIAGDRVSERDLATALASLPPSAELAELLNAREPLTGLPYPKVLAAWKFWGDLCRTYWRNRNPGWQGDVFFSKEHYLEEHWLEPLVQSFVAEAVNSPAIPFRIEDSAPGYFFNNTPHMHAILEKYNRIFIFRALSRAAMAALAACLADTEEKVTNCLGCYCRVVQTRYWEVMPGGEGVGTNSWHTDGFPLDALKILSFFSPVDEERGSTQFKRADGTIHLFRGPAGKWILFRNSVLEHAGAPPRMSESRRLTVETTLAPSLVPEMRPVFAGVNGHFPYVPWQGVRLNPPVTQAA